MTSVAETVTGAAERPGRDFPVRRAQRGDADAFESLYRDNVGRIYALCLRMTGDVTRAEELTQDVFVQAWTKLKLFRGESAFSTWLHRLAVNVVLQSMRSDKRRGSRETDDIDAGREYAAPAGSPESRIDLDRAIALLPPGARTAFVLHVVEGYPQEDISRMTGSAVGTIKAQVHRAKKLLREVLDR